MLTNTYAGFKDSSPVKEYFVLKPMCKIPALIKWGQENESTAHQAYVKYGKKLTYLTLVRPYYAHTLLYLSCTLVIP